MTTKAAKTTIVKPSKKLFISAIVLLVVGAVLVLAAYAWVVLSTRPSVEGMSVNIGSNGGLEIALLSDATYQNTDLILTSVGDSSEIRAVEEANLSWGNVLDLSSEAYGLRHIKLLPTILIADSGANGTVKLGDGILRIPTFGADGRITALDENALSGVYRDGSFRCSSDGEPHGVRAIGTASRITPRQREMILAHSGIAAAQTMARQTAANALQEHGSILFNIHARAARDPAAVYTDADLAALLALADAAETALNYLDAALRNAAISVLAGQIADQSQFESACALLKNEDLPLDRVFSALPAVLSGSFSTWADRIAFYGRQMSDARAACEALYGGVYSYASVAPITAYFVDPAQVYSGETLYDPKRPVPDGSQLTLMPGSGVFSGIADFTGSYSAYAKRWEGMAENAEVELYARTAETTPWLKMLSAVAMNLDAAGDGGYRFKLDDIYGYVIDMAFRTNIADANLLLQTEAVQRIYDDATLPDTQGAGSFIELYSSGLGFDRLVELMDAIRVSFVDGGGTLLAMAKLNTSNLEPYNEGYRAPLYLYDYSAANGAVVLGARRDAQGAITGLPQNTPTIVSAIVWLDGEAVNNSMVSFFGGSLTGALNLQFALDRELTPAENGDLHNDDWTPITNDDRILRQIASFSELPNADRIESLTLYADRTEALSAGETLSEDYYVVVRSGLPCFRLYVAEEMPDPEDPTAKKTVVTRYVMTGYDGDTLSLPQDSSGLFEGLWRLSVIEHAEKLNVETATKTDRLFSGCNSLQTVNEILPRLTHIGDNAFSWCYRLSDTATIRDGVTSIGDSAFYHCGLTGITIPEGVTGIGASAFSGCGSLTDITIPESVTSIGYSAFSRCYRLTGITIPEFTTSIGDSAFSDCSSLTEIAIPKSVTNIGYCAFVRCSNLTEIDVSPENPNYQSLDGVLFNRTGTELIAYPIGNTSGAYSIPEGVTTISDYAFSECSSLTGVMIPDGVASIGNSAFSSCFRLTDITIPASVTSIGSDAFSYCSGLTVIKIPTNVTNIGNCAFVSCSSLTEINVSTENPNYQSLDGVLFNRAGTDLIAYPAGKLSDTYSIPKGVTMISNSAFSSCSSLTGVTIPDSVTSIGYSAFSRCSSLTSVAIPEGVANISSGMFSGCEKLTSVIIPDSVTSIGSSAFNNCRSLTDITIPKHVTSIGSSAFNNCRSLTDITIPKHVTSIGSYVFDGCSNLSTIRLPASLIDIDRDAFVGCPAEIIRY